MHPNTKINTGRDTSYTLSAYTNDKTKLTGLIKHIRPAVLYLMLWAGVLLLSNFKN